MKAQVSTAALAVTFVAAVGPGGAVAAPDAVAAKRGEPLIEQMVVFRDGREVRASVRAKRTTVEVDGRSCAVAAATPLAALLRAPHLGKMRLFDYGSCSLRPADGSGLFVRALRKDVNKGLNGWVYKVGRKLGTAGAADPAGPFGDGRLRAGQQVTWFYCVFLEGSCQRSLEIEVGTAVGSELPVAVRGYDDAGEPVPVSNALVTARSEFGPPRSRRTDDAGKATFTLTPGFKYTLRASKPNANTRRSLIPSFPKQVRIG